MILIDIINRLEWIINPYAGKAYKINTSIINGTYVLQSYDLVKRIRETELEKISGVYIDADKHSQIFLNEGDVEKLRTLKYNNCVNATNLVDFLLEQQHQAIFLEKSVLYDYDTFRKNNTFSDFVIFCKNISFLEDKGIFAGMKRIDIQKGWTLTDFTFREHPVITWNKKKINEKNLKEIIDENAELYPVTNLEKLLAENNLFKEELFNEKKFFEEHLGLGFKSLGEK